ncbi:MlaD family protein [Taibaiella soli]|uniref:Mce/MlaD domain-containing protein n=1 Tax=Taibaiella soli TaxID=1649169 RepID=A0A2W2B004_9BACT|nr:MlaD family protein [Taibaiella soli]PZF73298.1 hypothetical protein DN068_09010 [Taibaiella soli]
MKIAKEVRIGLVVAIAILVFFTGFYFLKGSNLFSGENNFYADYDNVQGLTPSAVVQIKGVNVGKVTDINLDSKVRVTLAIDKKVHIPVGTKAELISLDLLGTKAIRLDLTNSSEYAKNGDVLPAAVESGIIDNISSEISPLVTDVRATVAMLDSVLTGINGIVNKQTQENIAGSIASLNETMHHFSSLSNRLDKESEQIAGIVDNANSITTNLKDNNEHISNILKNAEATTDQLSKAPIEQTVKNLQSTSDQLNTLMAKINNGEGSAGMLVNDKQLYNELTQALAKMKELMADLKSHPSRYINVSVFGKKQKDK